VENPRPRVSSAISGHLQIDTAIDYYHGRLDTDSTETIQDHLALCPECAALLLDLESFSQAEASPPADRTAARLLAQGITQQLRAERWRRATALAASLLVATVLPLGILSLRAGRSATVSARQGPPPDANLPNVSLYPRSSHRGAESNRVDLAGSHQLIAIGLPTEEPPRAPDFALKLIDSSGRELLMLRGLQPTATGTFNIGLPAVLLQPGRYLLRLASVQRGQLIPLEDYDLVVMTPRANAVAPAPLR
jgi:hypothetical protein